MKISRKIKTSFIALLAAWILRLWFFTLRVKIVNKKVYEKYFEKNKDEKNVVVGMWHRNAIFIIYFFRKLHRKIAMVSQSRDGELLVRFVKKFGVTIARGSSSRGGSAALNEIIEIMNSPDKKYVCGTAGDGPKGPAREFKKGMAVLAKKTDAYFIPIGVSGFNVITLSKTWDKTMLPKPFSKMVMIFGRPFKIPKDISDEEFKKVCLKIENEINDLTDKADSICGYKL